MAELSHDIHIDSTDAEIASCILDIKARMPSDAQVAAHLARILAASGDQIQSKSSFSADVASTGGPSSLSTLLCPLYLCAAGAVVPKLGVPGRPAGGIDCLMQISGYRSTFSLAQAEGLLEQFNYVHFLAGDRLTPLDARMFRIRQHHDAQEVPTLVAASLLAKKLAVGVRRAGLDIRVAPHGNFGKSWLEASENARLFIETGQLLSVKAFPVLTDARWPFQPFIGRCEALLALHRVFSEEACPWLNEHRILCRNLVLACTPLESQARVLGTTCSDLRKQFYRNLTAQGTSADVFEILVEATSSRHAHMLRASENGFARFDLAGIRRALVFWQEHSDLSDAVFPDPVGLILLKRPGEWVNRDEPVATVRIDNQRIQEVMHDLEQYVSVTSRLPIGQGIEGIGTDE
jgi:thymidine phosphorylase